MKSSFLVRGSLLALVLAPVVLAGQRTTKPKPEPPEDAGSACQAEGADCLFGTAGGCVVYCEPGQKAKCESASCTLGFPRSAKCSCR